MSLKIRCDVKTVTQKTFAERPSLDLPNEPLILHRRPDATNATLVVFVHGLGGARYGADSTWGKFPQLVFEDFDWCDVGLYRYRTATDRVKFWESIEIETEAQVLADILREADEYDNLILIGHSMGGIVLKGAVAHLITTNLLPKSRRVCLVLMAVPQTGSGWMHPIAAFFSKDAKALVPNNSYLRRIADVFNSCVDADATSEKTDVFRIPVWGLVSDSDMWVSQLSAGLNIPMAQKRVVRGSHTGIVKPKDREADSYIYVSKILKSRQTPSEQNAKNSKSNAAWKSAASLESPERLSDEQWLTLCAPYFVWAEKAYSEVHTLIHRKQAVPLREIYVPPSIQFGSPGTGTVLCNANYESLFAYSRQALIFGTGGAGKSSSADIWLWSYWIRATVSL